MINTSCYRPIPPAFGSWQPGKDDVASRLTEAIESGDAAKTVEIVDQYKVGNTPLSNGELPLAYAIRKGQQEVVQQLISSGCVDLNQKDDQGLTPIHHAVISKNETVIALVLGHMLGKSLQEMQQMLSHISPDKEIQDKIEKFKWELAQWKNIKAGRLSELERACLLGNLDKVKEFIRLPHQPSSGWEPLHLAVWGGHKEIIELLLDHGVPIDLLTSSRDSALHVAALRSDREMLQFLISKGLNPNQKNSFGYTPLHIAAAQEQLFNAQLLMENGGDPLAVSASGLTPITVISSFVKAEGNRRNPLKIDLIQALLCAAILVSQGVSYLPNNGELAANVHMMLGLLPVIILMQCSSDWKNHLALLACEVGLSVIPVLGRTYHMFKMLYISKLACEGLKRCWRNSRLDRFQSLIAGTLHVVNLAHSGRAIFTFSADIASKVHSGIFSRAKAFFPRCAAIFPLDECLEKFEVLENQRDVTGICWEHSVEGIQERWNQFSSLCLKEGESQPSCEKIFWSLELGKYFTDAAGGRHWDITVPGRALRWKEYAENCRNITHTAQSCQQIFDQLEQNKYLENNAWESGLSDMPKRWQQFRPLCEGIYSDDAKRLSCANRFLYFDANGLLKNSDWVKNVAGIEEREKRFTSVCRSELEQKGKGVCDHLFWNLENERYLNGIKWEKNWEESSKGFGERAKDFFSQCPKAEDLDECGKQWVQMERQRIAENGTHLAEVGEIGKRWQDLRSSCAQLPWTLDKCRQIFWKLEGRRYAKGEKWEQYLFGADERWKEFQPICDDGIKDIELRNFKTCSKIFERLEGERYRSGRKWEENWKNRWDGVETRWQKFNNECSSLNHSAVSCDKVFWDVLEHNLYTKGIVWEPHFKELAHLWDEFKQTCQRGSISADKCEEIFWTYLLSSVERPLVSCPEVNPDDFKRLPSHERIGSEKLNPDCESHAKLILGLEADWTKQDCKEAAKSLLLQLHPDKDVDNKGRDGGLLGKIRKAREMLCPRKRELSLASYERFR